MKLRLDGTTGIKTLLVGSHLLAFAGIWLSALWLLGGVEEAVRWYRDGGVAMHLILLLSVVQLATGIVAGLGQLRRDLPMGLHLGATAGAAFVGLAGAMVGVRMARAGIATAPPDLKLLLWGNALAIADIPRQLGLLAAAWGMLAQVVSSSLNLWLRARQDAPHAPTVVFSLLGASFLTGGVVWTFATTPQAKLPTVLAVLVALVAGVLFCLFFAAAGARGARSPLAAYDPYWQAAAFSAAWLATVGMVCWAMALGDAAFGVHQSATFQRLVSLPPELAGAVWRVAQAPAVLFGISRATSGITYAALLIGACLLWFARSKFLAWVEVRLAELTALLVIAAVLWGTDVYRDATLRRHHATLAAQLTSAVPPALDLPTSGAALRIGDVPLLVLRNGTLLLNGRVMGRADNERTFPVLIDRLRGLGSAGAPAGEPIGVVALAMDRDTSLATATDLARHLLVIGIQQLKLVTRERRHNPWPEANELRLHDELSLLGDFLTLIGRPKERVINVILRKARRNEPAATGAGPYLRLQGAEVIIVATKALELDPAAPEGVAAQVTAQLAAAKARAPDERRIRIDPANGQRWQDFVDLLDLARETLDEADRRQVLFDEPIWLLRR